MGNTLFNTSLSSIKKAAEGVVKRSKDDADSAIKIAISSLDQALFLVRQARESAHRRSLTIEDIGTKGHT